MNLAGVEAFVADHDYRMRCGAIICEDPDRAGLA
jgi:hypothetical protein